jgi:hypothetical protein
MFTVQVEYGMGAYAHVESCEGFETMDEAYSFASQILNEVSAVIREGVIADNAVIRVWKDNAGGQLINSCVKGCN